MCRTQEAQLQEPVTCFVHAKRAGQSIQTLARIFHVESGESADSSRQHSLHVSCIPLARVSGLRVMSEGIVLICQLDANGVVGKLSAVARKGDGAKKATAKKSTAKRKGGKRQQKDSG